MFTITGLSAVRRGVLAVLLLVAGGLEASTVRHLPLDQMARRADQIFTGEVVGITSQLNARRTGIYTFVTVAVDDYLKGGRRDLLTLRILGGEAEGYRLVVAGSPVFRLGEEVLVFSDGGARPGSRRCWGWRQGNSRWSATRRPENSSSRGPSPA